MTDQEQREAARQFFYKWNGKGKEDEDAHSYWIEILAGILGVDHVTDRLEFEKKVVSPTGTTNRIDVYIPETRVLIEQKSLGIPLDKPQAGHGGKTPFEQAREYDNYLAFDEKVRWIITSNFAEIWVYDMNTQKPEPTKILLSDLQTKYPLLEFLVKKSVKKITDEMKLSIQAGELVGKIHDRFLEQYNDPLAKHTQRSLNILCVRLVFCLFAEDAGLFPSKTAFEDYIGRYRAQDLRRALIDLFAVLNTPEDQRADMYLSDELEAFPYVNGGLFAEENIVVPRITDSIKQTLIDSSHFNWADISPTIFGAVFESTLNPETRRSGGMHYTSIENIHKVIDPLFLDDLKAELEEIKKVQVPATLRKRLTEYQDKLASLTFLDPACGSGNFLTETFLSIRRLENEAIKLRMAAERKQVAGQMTFGMAGVNPVKVSISQFYGIEINDFAVRVAQAALWIAESQMLRETEDIVYDKIDFLPLTTNAFIVEGNALRLDWAKLISPDRLSYIMGNPPFVGYSLQTREQKEDILSIYKDEKGRTYKTAGKIDYVAGWYFKAAQMMSKTAIRAAFVSTNSITQGEQVAGVWKPLYERFGIHIDFGHRTFVWESEANDGAAVHCVIVGFSFLQDTKPKRIYDKSGPQTVSNINPYLVAAENVFIEARVKPICEEIPILQNGGKPTEGGNLILTIEERDSLIQREPASEFIRPYMMGKDFIQRKPRYCIWLVNANPSHLKKCPEILKRIEAVREYRLHSPKEATRKKAATPMLFDEVRECSSDYVAIPKVSSERRRYIPMEYLKADIIPGDSIFMIPGSSVYHFGVLTANVHMAWVRAVTGRLKSDYRYSNTIVYNNFPWPTPTDDQKAKIEKTAQGILDARALYPDASLADLYDPLTMPPELQKAHSLNDAAVMQAYGMPVKTTTEADCVAWLMRLYQELVEKS